MKPLKIIGYTFLVITLFTFSQCKKNKPPIDQLPPETQTGANTFGCLVDGKIFKPSGDPFGGPIKSCAYQYIDGGYSFQLKAFDNEDPESHSVGMFTDSLEVHQGIVLSLKNRFEKGNAYGQYGRYNLNTGGKLFITDSISSGELLIKKLDQVNRIVSGTFWFDGFSTSGEKVEVREGRFDMKYTL